MNDAKMDIIVKLNILKQAGYDIDTSSLEEISEEELKTIYNREIQIVRKRQETQEKERMIIDNLFKLMYFCMESERNVELAEQSFIEMGINPSINPKDFDPIILEEIYNRSIQKSERN